MYRYKLSKRFNERTSQSTSQSEALTVTFGFIKLEQRNSDPLLFSRRTNAEV